ncbi:MAG: hypothetical protein QG622_2203 [Actinomycetota bacterium]|nr:hypothetical protein [Actinomycetota bacterium]
MLTARGVLRAGRGRGGASPRAGEADRGTSVIELVVAMSIMAVLLAGFMTVVMMMTKSTATAGSVSKATGELRTVVDSLGRQAAFASSVNTPTQVGTDLYLEMRTDSVAAGESSTCVQWRYRSTSGELQRRSWDTLTISPSTWTTVASNVRNDLATRPPFVVLQANSVHAKPVVTIDLLVRQLGQPSVSSSSAFTVRNFTGASGSSVCTEVARA